METRKTRASHMKQDVQSDLHAKERIWIVKNTSSCSAAVRIPGGQQDLGWLCRGVFGLRIARAAASNVLEGRLVDLLTD